MKAFICAMVILALVITGASLYAYNLGRTVDRLEAAAAVMADYAVVEDWPGCRSALSDFFEDWNKVYPHLEFFIHHNDIDRINQLLYEIEGYTTVENRDDFLVKCGVIRMLIHQIPDNERFTLENIL